MPFALKQIFLEEKQRAFLFLIKELGYTQKEAQRFIAKGRLLANGHPISKAGQEIEGNVEFIYFEPSTKGLKPNSEYEDFVVFDKPSGVLIHPQNRNTPYSLVDELKYQYGMDANIAHRIDQETSGLVLCAKNKESEKQLKTLFESREIKKTYLALAKGHMKESLTVEEPLLRAQDESAIVRMVVRVHESGKKSKTHFEPLEYFSDSNTTLVKCSPYTGRQHQIRVHLFHIDHPIVGDPIYGQDEKDVLRFLDKELDEDERMNKSGAKRLLLHANELEFSFKEKDYHIVSQVDFIDEIKSNLAFDL